MSGNYRKTAEKVVQMLGLKLKEKNVMESFEVEKISKEELKKRIDEIILFTRVTPHQKRKIIDCLQEKGEIVAMRGDGVNDALALREAEVRVAGGSESEVAKEAGDLVLLDNNFKTIISTCEEGRSIFYQYQKNRQMHPFKFIFRERGHLFSWNFKIPSAFNYRSNFMASFNPDLTFVFEPKEKNLMKRAPIDVKKEPILDKFLLRTIGIVTVFVTLLIISLYWYLGIKNENLALRRTLVFATLASIDLIYIFSFKNLKKSIPQMENFFQNKFLFLSILYGFLLLFAAVYLPPFNKILGTYSLSWWDWILVFSIGVMTTFVLEISKSFHKISKSQWINLK